MMKFKQKNKMQDVVNYGMFIIWNIGIFVYFGTFETGNEFISLLPEFGVFSVIVFLLWVIATFANTIITNEIFKK